MEEKVKLFIASSVEGLEIAETMKVLLEYSDIRAEVWTQGAFKNNGYPLYQLEKALEKYDFGLFIMTPDDMTERRGEKVCVARDNVLLELGMFIGHFGSEYCFIIQPRGDSAPKMPSDMTGFQTLDYEIDWFADNRKAALGAACTDLKKMIYGQIEQDKKVQLENDNVQNEIDTINYDLLEILFNLEEPVSCSVLATAISCNTNEAYMYIEYLIAENYVGSHFGYCQIEKQCVLYRITSNGTREHIIYAQCGR